jgi:hypothetical protein
VGAVSIACGFKRVALGLECNKARWFFLLAANAEANPFVSVIAGRTAKCKLGWGHFGALEGFCE